VLLETLGELARGFGLTADAYFQGLQSAQQQEARIGRGDDPRASAELLQARCVFLASADDRAEYGVVVPGKLRRRAVEAVIGAVLERSKVDGR
jgi:hypothetical protein